MITAAILLICQGHTILGRCLSAFPVCVPGSCVLGRWWHWLAGRHRHKKLTQIKPRLSSHGPRVNYLEFNTRLHWSTPRRR